MGYDVPMGHFEITRSPAATGASLMIWCLVLGRVQSILKDLVVMVMV